MQRLPNHVISSLSISQGVPHKWGRDGAGKQQTDGCSIDEDVLWWRESRIKAKMSVDSVTPVATSNGYWRNQIVAGLSLTERGKKKGQ